MRSEFKIIKDELNCNAIGFHGSFNDKLLKAAKIALEEELEVWLFPRYINKNIEETLGLFKEFAFNAEKLRKEYGKLILGIGDELTVNCSSFFSGKKYVDRVRRLTVYIFLKNLYPLIMGEKTDEWFFKFKDREFVFENLFPDYISRERIEEFEDYAISIERFLKEFDEKFMKFIEEMANIGRNNFNGKITYSSGWWEELNWKLFDIIGIGMYMDQTNWFIYSEILKKLKERFNMPLVVTEFGAATFRHASMYGGGAWLIFDKHEVERSEEEQAEHIERQFNLIRKSGADGAFCFIFLDVPEKVHVENPKYYKEDGDRGGYGIMKIYPDGRLEPKKSFYVLKNLYKSVSENSSVD
ncbi:MAG: hypothetical protein QW040_01650 [Candidatus Aenigmatarchaeota archaeon]